MKRLIDLTNEKIGRWTIIKRKGKNANGKILWLCVCECGNYRMVLGDNLRNGVTKSCGCLKNEKIKERALKHGMTKTPTYITWLNIKQRCFNHKNKRYPNYGGMGITVCEAWLKFENFYADMGKRPEGLTVERIDNELGYFKDNCKWGTYAEQSRNTQNNIMITYNKQTLCMRDWAEKTGIKYTTLWHRLKKYPPEIAFNI